MSITCQILIACVTDVVHTLNRVAPTLTWDQRFSKWLDTFPEPFRFVVFFVILLCVVTLVACALMLLVLLLIQVWQDILPSRPRKRRYGEFVGD